jgi:hypothetical protein
MPTPRADKLHRAHKTPASQCASCSPGVLAASIVCGREERQFGGYCCNGG